MVAESSFSSSPYLFTVTASARKYQFSFSLRLFVCLLLTSLLSPLLYILLTSTYPRSICSLVIHLLPSFLLNPLANSSHSSAIYVRCWTGSSWQQRSGGDAKLRWRDSLFPVRHGASKAAASIRRASLHHHQYDRQLSQECLQNIFWNERLRLCWPEKKPDAADARTRRRTPA